MASISPVLQWFVECHHNDRSRVFTINKRSYQTCLTCGHETAYAWERMGSLQNGLGAIHSPVQGDKLSCAQVLFVYRPKSPAACARSANLSIPFTPCD